MRQSQIQKTDKTDGRFKKYIILEFLKTSNLSDTVYG